MDTKDMIIILCAIGVLACGIVTASVVIADQLNDDNQNVVTAVNNTTDEVKNNQVQTTNNHKVSTSSSGDDYNKFAQTKSITCNNHDSNGDGYCENCGGTVYKNPYQPHKHDSNGDGYCTVCGQ